jgi:hypothetical protein
MNEHGALPPDFEELADRMREFAYRQAIPRLSAEEVRRKGVRRRRIRHGAAALGSSGAVAGVVVAVLFTVGHSPAAVVQPAGTRPASVPATPPGPTSHPTTPSPEAVGTPSASASPGSLPPFPTAPTTQVSAPSTSPTPTFTSAFTPGGSPSSDPGTAAGPGL